MKQMFAIIVDQISNIFLEKIIQVWIFIGLLTAIYNIVLGEDRRENAAEVEQT